MTEAPRATPRPRAPDLVGPTASGELFALGEQLGRWVVVRVFPAEDVPDCACDATVFTDQLWRLGQLDAVVVGLSGLDPRTLAKRASKYALTYPVVYDTDGSSATALDAFDRSRPDPYVRTTLLVDPDGRVAARWDDVDAADHGAQVLAALERARAALPWSSIPEADSNP